MDEKKLVQESQKGSGEAFRVLVDRYKDRILNIIFRIVGDRNECEDVAQEVFVKAYTRIDGFGFKSSFYTWLYRIAVNTAVDYAKKRRSRRALSLEELPVELGARKNSPLDEVLHEELSGEIGKAFQNLAPKYRVVVVLREVEGCSYEEIAEILKCSKGTVESRLFRARAKLKERLKGFLSPSCEGLSERRL